MKVPVKFHWSRARAVLVGVALIAVTNAVVLAGVAYNRSGQPEAVLRLTERELRLRDWSWPANENSSIDLHLHWRVVAEEWDYEEPYVSLHGGLHWLQPAQLQQLGFDVSGNMESNEDARRVSGQPSRRVWLVLEYDGPAYQASLERARKALERASSSGQVDTGDDGFGRTLKSAKRELLEEQLFHSRLFIVDAALDADALRARYPDRHQYVVVRGRLGVTVRGPQGRLRPTAIVRDIDVGAIRVPHGYREIVEPLTRTPSRAFYDKREPRFAATVNFGRRFEPWIVDLEPLQATQP